MKPAEKKAPVRAKTAQAKAALPKRRAAAAKRGMIIILSSPSGTGKTTLTHRLRQDSALNLGVSVSITTRKMRPSEKNGIDYHFVDEAEFQRLIAADAFVEWAKVHGAYYGSLQQTVNAVLQDGQDILFDIDYQGARQVRQKQPQDTVSIFILPPSIEELQRRLRARAENSAADISLRLHNAAAEMRHWQLYDYILVNHDLERSAAALRAIISAEHFKRSRSPALQSFVDGLIAAAESV